LSTQTFGGAYCAIAAYGIEKKMRERSWISMLLMKAAATTKNNNSKNLGIGTDTNF
jgi:hypothetical protein